MLMDRKDLLICTCRYCIIAQKRHLVANFVETILEEWNDLDEGTKKIMYSDISKYLYVEDKCADVWNIFVAKYKSEF